MQQPDEDDANESLLSRLLQWTFGICVLVVFASMVRLPETAGHVALWVMGAIVAIQFGQQFLKGVADAGGWTGKRAVKPPAAPANPPADSK
jgi:hypothetical protein